MCGCATCHQTCNTRKEPVFRYDSNTLVLHWWPRVRTRRHVQQRPRSNESHFRQTLYVLGSRPSNVVSSSRSRFSFYSRYNFFFFTIGPVLPYLRWWNARRRHVRGEQQLGRRFGWVRLLLLWWQQRQRLIRQVRRLTNLKHPKKGHIRSPLSFPPQAILSKIKITRSLNNDGKYLINYSRRDLVKFNLVEPSCKNQLTVD